MQMFKEFADIRTPDMIDFVPDEVKSIEMTATMELQLSAIQNGTVSADDVIKSITNRIVTIIEAEKKKPHTPVIKPKYEPKAPIGKCPKCGGIGNYHSLGKTEYKGVKYAELGDKNDIAHLPKQNNKFAASLMAELDKAGIKYQARVEDMTSISVNKADMPRVTDIKNELVKTLNPEKQTNSAPKHKR